MKDMPIAIWFYFRLLGTYSKLKMQIDYQVILDEIYNEIRLLPDEGQVAGYIPELAAIDPNKFGVHLHTIEGVHYGAGDHHERFSIQSIGKVLALILAFQKKGEDIWDRVGVEPSGNPFNSLWQLEYEHGKPRNPLINSGAIVICDILCSLYDNPGTELISFIRKISGISSISFNEKIAASERSLGFRNAALINLMKASGNIQNEIDQVLHLYYHQCSIEMSCADLAATF